MITRNEDRLPTFTQVFLHHHRNPAVDVKAEVKKQFSELNLSCKPKASIAVAVGSRGITQLFDIVSEVLSCIKSMGAEPFIVPAMGSHGNADAEGQKEVLKAYGITEKALGVPICSSLEVVELENTGLDCKVYMDRLAFHADGIILVNRVKPHTDYHGFPESGLLKMSVIGLGNHAQAMEIHKFGVSGLKTRILPAAQHILSTGKIAAGIAVVEDQEKQIIALKALLPHQFVQAEQELLELAYRHLPALPVEEADLLIIDWMGKDICGVGIDPKVIGRLKVPGQSEPQRPNFSSIAVLNLTEDSKGNGIGIGLADVVTKRLADKIDFDATYENVVTSGFLQRGSLPIVAPNDRQAVLTALRGAGVSNLEQASIIRIRNTSHTMDLMVTPSLFSALKQHTISTVHESLPMFGPDGSIIPWK